MATNATAKNKLITPDIENLRNRGNMFISGVVDDKHIRIIVRA